MIRVNPQFPGGYFSRGVDHGQHGELAEAIAELPKVSGLAEGNDLGPSSGARHALLVSRKRPFHLRTWPFGLLEARGTLP